MTSKIELGRLESVPLSEVWANEAADFTPWVSSPDGLQLIGEALDLELETLPTSSEVPVGDFRADVVCVDTSESGESLVLIENQLASSDHSHVGQVLTYAAGLNALTIIWIASKFRDEHLAVVEWLNQITSERYRFFGLEIKLVRIGRSNPAARFAVVAKPNDWSRDVRRRNAPDRAHSDLPDLHLEFWTKLCAHVKRNGIDVPIWKPLRQRWMGIRFGPTGAWLNAVRLVQPPSLRVEAHFSYEFQSAYFAAMDDVRDEIEAEIGTELVWDQKNRTSRIYLTTPMDPRDRDEWPAQINWFVNTLQKFDRTFRHRLEAVDPADW